MQGIQGFATATYDGTQMFPIQYDCQIVTQLTAGNFGFDFHFFQHGGHKGNACIHSGFFSRIFHRYQLLFLGSGLFGLGFLVFFLCFLGFLSVLLFLGFCFISGLFVSPFIFFYPFQGLIFGNFVICLYFGLATAKQSQNFFLGQFQNFKLYIGGFGNGISQSCQCFFFCFGNVVAQSNIFSDQGVTPLCSL